MNKVKPMIKPKQQWINTNFATNCMSAYLMKKSTQIDS